METVYFLLLLLFTVQSATADTPDASNRSDARHSLYLLTLLPYPDPRPNLQPSWDLGPDMIPAAELAAEHINAREDILSEYKLELINEDCGCNISSKALIGFVRQVLFYRDNQIVGIVGAGCSRSVIATSPLSGRSEVSLINVHLGGSPLLANRTLYPLSFSILGSSLLYVETIFGLIDLNDWRLITALYDETRVFFYTTFLNVEKLYAERVPSNDSEISFSSAVSFTNIPLRTIKDTGIRITFVLTGPEYARWIMCLAYYQNMLYPMHQWIIVGRELSEFKDTKFIYNGRMYSCTRDLFANTILNGVLLLNYRIRATQHDIVSAQTGYSFDTFWELYKERVTKYNDAEVFASNISATIWATIVYDAVWTLALALNSSGVNLTDYRFNHSNVTDQIRTHIHDMELDGVSGHVNYDNETGFTTRLIDIHQVFNATEHLVAHSDEGNITVMPEADPQFVLNVFITLVADQRVHLAVGVLFMAIIIVELVFVIVAHIISIVYRKYKSIKAASPKLNYLIYIGCYVTIATTLIYVLIKISNFDDETTGAICHANWAWLFPVGYTLVFGTIAARTWRLYRIFTYYLDPGPFISDPVLFAFVFILLFIDIIYAIIWTAIDPIHTEYDEAISTGGDTLERSRRCASHHYVWYLILVGNKSLLLLVVGTLSLLTRNIANKTYSTHDLRVGVYLLIITTVIGIPLFIVFSLPQINYHPDVIVLSLEVEAHTLLLLIFILFPPLVPLLKEKYLHVHVQPHKYLQILQRRSSRSSSQY